MIRKLTVPTLVLLASTLTFAGPHHNDVPPAPPAPPVAPVPPSPPMPPVLQHNGAGGDGGVTVRIHDGKVEIDGIQQLIDQQLDAAQQQLDAQGSALPPELRAKLQKKLAKLRTKLDRRVSHLDATDMEHLGEELGQIGEEIGQEMEGFGSDMGDWGQKLGEDMAKKFAKKNWFKGPMGPMDPMHGRQPVDPYAGNDNDNDNDNDVPSVDVDDEHHVDLHDAGGVKLRGDQRDKLRTLREQTRQDIEHAKEELERASDELQNALDNENKSEAEVDQLIDEVTAKENKIRKAKLHAWLRTRGALEQDQRRALRELVKHKQH